MPLVEHFIDAGFDILNPVQWNAANMSGAELMARFGDRITFWGGGVNTQYTLPFGTPDEVRKEVWRSIDLFGKGGGFVFSAIHNVQPQVPVENLLALFEAVAEYGGSAT
jgi:uroporphyrinogen-III decarboxylase